MLANRGYAAYANNKITTASPAELTLMLYEGAIKFCNIAITATEEKDIEKAHKNIIKDPFFSPLDQHNIYPQFLQYITQIFIYTF